MLRKLTSRKLWMALAGVTTGIAIALGANTSDVQMITGAITAVLSLVTYIYTEGKVDAANVANTVTATQNALDVVVSKND